MKNIVIITGASSGFGELFATTLDNKLKSIDEYWLIARNTEKMAEIAKAMSTPCRILGFDLTKDESVKEIIKCVEREADDCEDDLYIKMLINSAGYGKLGDFSSINDVDVSGMIDLNITALTCLTKGLLPYMARNSRIINIASVAAFLPQPGFAEYAATKAYVLSFSRALNAELGPRGISVIAVCPGPSSTNFFNVAEEHAKTPWYKKHFMANPKKVVDKAIRDSINKCDISIYGIWMKLLYAVTRVAPQKIVLKFIKQS